MHIGEMLKRRRGSFASFYTAVAKRETFLRVRFDRSFVFFFFSLLLLWNSIVSRKGAKEREASNGFHLETKFRKREQRTFVSLFLDTTTGCCEGLCVESLMLMEHLGNIRSLQGWNLCISFSFFITIFPVSVFFSNFFYLFLIIWSFNTNIMDNV